MKLVSVLVLLLASRSLGFVTTTNTKLSSSPLQWIAHPTNDGKSSTSNTALSMSSSLALSPRYRQRRVDYYDDDRRYDDYEGRALSLLSSRPRRQSSLAYKPQVERVVALINQERDRLGEDRLFLNHNLCVAAKKAARIIKRQGDLQYNNGSLKKRIQASGYEDIDPDTYECAGWQSLYTESYIAGSNDVDYMVDSLLDGTFRDELVSSTFDEVGVAVENELMVITLGTIIFEEKQPFTRQEQRDYADRVFYLTNLERTNYGYPPLKRSMLLDEAAHDHAVDMYERGYYSHDSPEGESCGDRIAKTGYFHVDKTNAVRWQTGVAENIAMGQQTPEQVVKDWMNSKEHRDNILAPEMLELGVGVYGEHWVQNFGRVFVKYNDE